MPELPAEQVRYTGFMHPGDDRPAEAPGPAAVLVVGEVVMDLVPTGADGVFRTSPGGSPANVAVGLARLDVPVRLAARLADDLFGRRLHRHLADNGIDLSVAVRAAEPSSLAVLAITADGGPEYDFRVADTADWQWRDAELAAALTPDGVTDVVAVHSGSLTLTTPPGADAVARLLQRARPVATVSFHPNCRPLLMGRRAQVARRVADLVRLADVVKLSAEDLGWLLPGVAAERLLRDWLAAGPALVAVTLGPDGVLAAGPGAGVVRRPGRPVHVVDTVGAGDAFTAALLAALYRRDLLGAHRRADLHRIGAALLADMLDEAVLAAALSCTRPGADPPHSVTVADERRRLARSGDAGAVRRPQREPGRSCSQPGRG